jgi:hypothetical protein
MTKQKKLKLIPKMAICEKILLDTNGLPLSPVAEWNKDRDRSVGNVVFAALWRHCWFRFEKCSAVGRLFKKNLMSLLETLQWKIF